MLTKHRTWSSSHTWQNHCLDTTVCLVFIKNICAFVFLTVNVQVTVLRFIFFLCFYSRSHPALEPLLRHVECAVYVLKNEQHLSFFHHVVCGGELSFCRDRRWSLRGYIPSSVQWKIIAGVQSLFDKWAGNAASSDQWGPRSRLRRVSFCSPSLYTAF